MALQNALQNGVTLVKQVFYYQIEFQYTKLTSKFLLVDFVFYSHLFYISNNNWIRTLFILLTSIGFELTILGLSLPQLLVLVLCCCGRLLPTLR